MGVFLILITPLLGSDKNKAIPAKFCPKSQTLVTSALSEKHDLSNYLKYHSESDPNIQFNDIIYKRESLDFLSTNGNIPNFGNTDKRYWFCFEIKNDTASPLKLITFIKYPLLDEIKFFDIFSEGNITEKTQGRLYTQTKREVKYRGFGHEIQLNAGELRTIFIEVKTDSSMSVPIYISKEKDFYDFVAEDFIFQGIYFGIVGVMTLYNLFVFLLFRDKAYIFYVIYLLFGSIFFQLSLNGLLPLFFFPDSPALVWHLHNIIYYLFLLLTFPMSITFMNLKENSTFFYRTFLVFMIFPSIGIVLLFFLPYRLMNESGDVFSMLVAILGLVTSYYIAFVGKFRPGLFFFFAFLFVIIGGIGTLLKYMGVLPVNAFTENAFQIAMAIEVVLMAFGLGDRITLIGRDNERIQMRAEVNKQKLMAFQKELILAQKLQESTLPENFIHPEDIDIKAGYKPASLVGGDFYDIIKLSETELSCLIADVTGHGVPAAIEAAMLKIAYTQSLRFASSPGLILEKINRSLVGTYKNQFLTASALYFNLEEKYFRVANAGHPPLYHLSHKNRSISSVRPKGKLIGFSKDVDYPEEEYLLESGDRFVIYTDGLWDIWERDETGHQSLAEGSGETELINWFYKNWDLEIDKMMEEIDTFISKRTRNIAPEDDITYLVFAVR
ncbi:MAG: 7TM diverse intracellular signaling domain-containing protein [Leptospira sp.]|nr:7TM diverse intracellular signaling domain-containing protein [Leptospira sp.]